jgi:phage shock protein A
LRREAEDWEAKAEIALGKDREDLARAALKEKAGAEEAGMAIEVDLEVIDHNLEKLSSDIAQLQAKLVDAKTRQKTLIVRGRTAQTRMGVKRQIHDVNIDEALNRFDRYERRIDDLEGEIEAYDLGQQTLADEIADLEDDERVDEELERLKAKMGQVSSPAETKQSESE